MRLFLGIYLFLFDAIYKEADQEKILLLSLPDFRMHHHFILHLVFRIPQRGYHCR